MHEIKEFFNRENDNKKKNKINDRTIRCQLCPHNCLIAENKKGLCGTRINVEGKLYSITYGMPSAINIDPIEKKPLYHFYPGSKILSIGTIGCNLFCKGCQNYDISRANVAEINTNINKTDINLHMTPEDIIKLAINNNIQMIAYTYNEPTVFYEYMIDIAKLAKKNKIKNVIVSNGFINDKPLKKLLKYLDAANIDLKGFNEQFYKEYANAKLAPVLKTLKTIKKTGTWLEVTNLIIPGLNDDEVEIEKMCRWIRKNLKDTPLHFSRFFPYYKMQNKEITPDKKLRNAKEIAIKQGIKYVYLGNIGILENTYCIYCNNLLIEREHKIRTIGIYKGRCIKCRKKIPGVFN